MTAIEFVAEPAPDRRCALARHAVASVGRRRAIAAGRRIWFWMRRYGPAEIAGTGAILLLATPWQVVAAPVAVVTLVAVIAESLGFYGVMAVSVHRELRRSASVRSRRTAASRTVALLAAEFGPAEILDTLLLRPAMVATALLVVGGGAALLVGKIAADLAFYAIAGGAFVLTRRLGWRPERVHG